MSLILRSVNKFPTLEGCCHFCNRTTSYEAYEQRIKTHSQPQIDIYEFASDEVHPIPIIRLCEFCIIKLLSEIIDKRP